jgi:Na+-translocating ferredoxin:NAD+ oxidoreductase RnfC subunit
MQDLVKTMREAGIVGAGGAGFPTTKMRAPSGRRPRTRR